MGSYQIQRPAEVICIYRGVLYNNGDPSGNEYKVYVTP